MREVLLSGSVVLIIGSLLIGWLTGKDGLTIMAPVIVDPFKAVLAVFLLDMGKSIKIMDLARRMIELSGLTVRDGENPAGDIAIEVTGLRPGEKLYEELLIGDTPAPTAHPMIMKSLEATLPRVELERVLAALGRAGAAHDAPAARRVLLEGVAGYRPTGGIVDWVHCEQVMMDRDRTARG